MALDNRALVRAALRLRDKRAQLTKDYEDAYAKITKDMEKLENLGMRVLMDAGTESMRTDEGTFYREMVVTPRGEDWEAFYDWVAENNAFDALERRIKREFVKQYMEAHQGAIPPGVSVFREYRVRFRKANK
jgi:hypothetical protein